MGYEVLLAQEDLLSCRFAISPLWETAQAAHAIFGSLRTPTTTWLDTMRSRAGQLEHLDLGPLLALQPASGAIPDFLYPPPHRPLPDISEELDRVLQTPSEVVQTQIAHCLADQNYPSARPHLLRFLEDPVAERKRVVSLLEACWSELVEPDWPKIQSSLQQDIDFHARHLAEHGLGATLRVIASRLHFADGMLYIPDQRYARYSLEGHGVVLRPSAFIWPRLMFSPGPALNSPWPPTVIYPGRGTANLWERSSSPAADPLARLLGRTRAALLADLSYPSSTQALAAKHAASPSGVSEHLKALRDAGLVQAARYKREVLYQCTPLGHSLLGACGQT